MQIQLYLGEQIVTASNVVVRVNPEDRVRAEALVHRTRKDVQEVSTPEEFELARQAAGEIKGMLDEIENDRKAAKTPFTTIGRTMDDLAHRVAGPVKNEQDRILGLMSQHVAKLEAARQKKEREEAEARRLAQIEADRKVSEAQLAAQKAQEQLRLAQDAIERGHLREVAQQRENALLQQQLAAELAADVEELGKEPPKSFVPGGRVNHAYDFELINVQATCEARCYRLLRWELDILACRDSVKNQLEGFPEIEPTLPGIKITKRLNVSVKAASRIK